jgi:hypothetical protein
MTTAYPQEAWCPRCHVSHPPGTRRCLHCGQGVLPVRPGTEHASVSARETQHLPFPAEPPGDDEAEAAPSAARPLRIGFATLWLILAIAGAVLRSCAERS